MSGMDENNCYFEGKRINSEQMLCLAQVCIVCKDGKWRETHKIFVL
jgi:hypothetical protein